MITPLMLILSSINDKLEFDRPVNIDYMANNDRTLLNSEIERHGRLLFNPDVVVTEDDIRGVEVVSTTQVINDSVVEIHPATAIILTRLREGYTVYKRRTSLTESASSAVDDLSVESAVLHIEGNPKYAYIFVHTIMESKGMDYDSKIQKIANLYKLLQSHSVDTSDDTHTIFLSERLKLQSDIAFWTRLIHTDWMRQRAELPPKVDEKLLATVRQELQDMGFYGFTNPWKMYTDFHGSRMTRKAVVHVDESVEVYLSKVVRSGGLK